MIIKFEEVAEYWALKQNIVSGKINFNKSFYLHSYNRFYYITKREKNII